MNVEPVKYFMTVLKSSSYCEVAKKHNFMKNNEHGLEQMRALWVDFVRFHRNDVIRAPNPLYNLHNSCPAQ